jgi:hypothetical protein
VPRKRRNTGVSRIRSMLKRLPDDVKRELIVQHHLTGREVLALQKSKAPSPGKKGTGALRNALSMKVLPASNQLKVGLLGKPINRRLFYGRIFQFGRKEQVVVAARSYGKLAGAKMFGGGRYKNMALKAGVKGVYKLPIRAISPVNFIYPLTREEIAKAYIAIWERALQKAAGGPQ